MTTWPMKDQDDAYGLMVQARIDRQLLEEDLQLARDRSRQIVIQAITEHGISVAKASELSGHHRNSITLWLQIHNAEQKKGKTRGTGE